MFLQQLDEILDYIQETFYDAALGSIPLAVAAVTADAAYESAGLLSAGLSSYGIETPGQLEKRFNELQNCLHVYNTSNSDHASSICSKKLLLSEEAGLNMVWKILRGFRDDIQSGKKYQRSHSSDYCAKCSGKTEISQGTLSICRSTLVSVFAQGLKQMHDTKSELPFSICLSQDFKTFLETRRDNNGKTENKTDLALSFGLIILLESCIGYEKGSKKLQAKKRNPRLMALRFAATAKSEVSTTVRCSNAPCACLKISERSVLEDITFEEKYLSHFLGTKRFDLFFQNPWISGGHQARQMARIWELGAKTWHYGYYLGTLLHLYNALSRVGLIAEPIPILDWICGKYEETVFLGKRDSRAGNALACWKRWAGGRIKPIGHNRSKAIVPVLTKDGGAARLHLCANPDDSQGGNTERRSFSPSKISLFALLLHTDNFFSDKVLAWLYLPEEKRSRVSIITADSK